MYVEKKISPLLPKLAQQSAEDYLYRTVNETVGQLAAEGALHYDRLVSTVRDEQGQVIYLEVNTSRLNEAKSLLVARIDGALKEKTRLTVRVPFGSLTEAGVLGGRGFPVWVKVYAISTTTGEIDTVLEDCGINQTRHLIALEIQTKLYLVLPGEDREAALSVRLPLGERVLVGDVPEIYLDTLGAS